MPGFGGSWSESKLICVEDYARAYLQVMQYQEWATLHYVDAFAGRGKQALKSGAGANAKTAELDTFFGNDTERAETQAFLEGSALRALSASSHSDRPFDHFTLIDAHEPSCKELRSLIAVQYPDALGTIDVECEDANDALVRYVRNSDWRTTRSLVFLDPFGLEVRWATIEALAHTGGCDVWYLFPLGGVMRMMTNDGEIPVSWRHRLDELFGTQDWYREFYPATQLSLSDDDAAVALKDASTAHVVSYIQQRLLTAFPAVSEAGLLRNSTGFPLFALLLGVSNPGKSAQAAALKIGNHLVRRISAP